MARDRKRAKQRQQQRRTRQEVPAAAPTELHRADLPGALEHASGEVDEFDAALIRGAGGVPAVESESTDASAPEARAGAPSEPVESEPVESEPVESQRNGGGRDSSTELAPAGGGSGRRGGNGNGTAVEAFGEGAAAPAPRERRQSLPRRAVAFLRASWAELQRVQWPDRRQVSQATAVVIGFVIVAGAYLGAADWVAQRIVNFIL